LIGRCSPAVASAIRARSAELGIAPTRIVLIGENSYVSRERIHHLTTTGPWIAGLALFPPTPHYMRKELTKFFEYMEAGLPILASDFPKWTDIIHETVGYTVTVGDLDGLRRRAETLEGDADMRARFGARGRELVAKQFNWTRQEEKLVELYRDLVGS
jgi:glycosyltransferase involved in cell wall biosynthesis